jgi:spermidine synthase
MLLGLAVGGIGAAALSRRWRDPRALRSALGGAQALLVAAMFWASWALRATVYRWTDTGASSPWLVLALDFWRCSRIIGPAALLWGASLPLEIAALSDEHGRVSERLVARAYAWNTLGAVAAAVVTSTVLIPSIGTQYAQRLCVLIAAFAAWLLWRSPWAKDTARSHVALIVGLGGAAGICSWLVRPVPPELVGYGPAAPAEAKSNAAESFLFVGEGANASIAVSRTKDRALCYHNAGKVQASTGEMDMRLQRMLGHSSTFFVREPRNVLTIGFGAGVTAGAVSMEPALERQTIVEIEALVPPTADRFFGRYNGYVLRNPKARVVIDDARHFLSTSDEKYDAITVDPFDPWARGAAALTTREFLSVMKRQLNPGGVVAMWVPLYETTEEVVRTEIETFVDVFPEALLFGNAKGGRGYDTVLIGPVDRPRLDIDALEARLARSEYLPMRHSLHQIGFTNVSDLLATYAAGGSQLRAWAAGAPLNLDRDLRLQYLAGLRASGMDPEGIYTSILRSSAWQTDLFVGNPDSVARVRARYEHARASALGAHWRPSRRPAISLHFPLFRVESASPLRSEHAGTKLVTVRV